MIGGLPYTRYYVIGFTSDTESFEIDLSPHITFQEVQNVIGKEMCPDVQELHAGSYPIKKEDLIKLGIDNNSLPDADYFFSTESDGFYKWLEEQNQ